MIQTMATGAATLDTQLSLTEPPSAPLLQGLRSTAQTPSGRLLLACAAAATALLLLCFSANLRHFAYTWSTDENYSHGFLVPLISLYFANEAARRGPVTSSPVRRLGLVLLIASMLGKIATVAVPVGIIGDLSLLVGLAGLLALFGGRKLLRRYGFAVAFLVFMIPLPIALYTAIAGPLQLAVSKVAAVLLNLAGIPVLRQGNMMTLPGGLHMFVAEACSGMRQLTGFLALSTAVAYLTPRPVWYRALLVVASVPIAMVANIIRVVVTGLIMFRLDPRYAAGTYHTAEGLLMMAVGLGLLGAFSLLLSSVFPAGRPASNESEPAPAAGASSLGLDTATVLRRALPGLAVLLTGLLAQQAVDAATATTRPELRAPLADLPLRLGTWVGEDLPIDPKIRKESQADDCLSRSYEDTSQPGRKLTLWINYSRHGLNLRHTPTVCLPSGGWEAVESQTRVMEVERPAGALLPVTRLVYRQGELVQGIGFWYYIFGEGRLEQLVRRLPVSSRSSHGRTTRGSGLTVELFCPAELDPEGETIRQFAATLLDELEPLLPPDRAPYFRP